MELVKVQKKYQITLPKAVRDSFNLEEGDFIVLEQKEGVVSLLPLNLIPKDQHYFYTKEWQAGETEADRDIERGNYIGDFENIDDAIKSLHKASN